MKRAGQESRTGHKESGASSRDMPKGHKIVVHLDEEDVKDVIIPQKKDIDDIEA